MLSTIHHMPPREEPCAPGWIKARVHALARHYVHESNTVVSMTRQFDCTCCHVIPLSLICIVCCFLQLLPSQPDEFGWTMKNLMHVFPMHVQGFIDRTKAAVNGAMNEEDIRAILGRVFQNRRYVCCFLFTRTHIYYKCNII